MTKKNKLPIAKGSVAPSAPSMAPGTVNDDMKWKAEEALRTIERAEMHKSDSALMKHVSKLANDKMSALKKICK